MSRTSPFVSLCFGLLLFGLVAGSMGQVPPKPANGAPKVPDEHGTRAVLRYQDGRVEGLDAPKLEPKLLAGLEGIWVWSPSAAPRRAGCRG